MLADEREHVLDVIAGVDDHGFARGFVANDRAVALQRTDGEDFVDHLFIVARTHGNSRIPGEHEVTRSNFL